jgi:hypothetical protein
LIIEGVTKKNISSNGGLLKNLLQVKPTTCASLLKGKQLHSERFNNNNKEDKFNQQDYDLLFKPRLEDLRNQYQ